MPEQVKRPKSKVEDDDETYTRFHKNSILEMARLYCQLCHSFINLVLITYIYIPLALQPNASHGLLILDEVSRSHTTTHHNR